MLHTDWLILLDNYTDTYNEIGLSITGGVHCARCKVSHAVITKVSPSVAEKGFPSVKEGMF